MARKLQKAQGGKIIRNLANKIVTPRKIDFNTNLKTSLYSTPTVPFSSTSMGLVSGLKPTGFSSLMDSRVGQSYVLPEGVTNDKLKFSNAIGTNGGYNADEVYENLLTLNPQLRGILGGANNKNHTIQGVSSNLHPDDISYMNMTSKFGITGSKFRNKHFQDPRWRDYKMDLDMQKEFPHLFGNNLSQSPTRESLSFVLPPGIQKQILDAENYKGGLYNKSDYNFYQDYNHKQLLNGNNMVLRKELLDHGKKQLGGVTRRLAKSFAPIPSLLPSPTISTIPYTRQIGFNQRGQIIPQQHMTSGKFSSNSTEAINHIYNDQPIWFAPTGDTRYINNSIQGELAISGLGKKTQKSFIDFTGNTGKKGFDEFPLTETERLKMGNFGFEDNYVVDENGKGQFVIDYERPIMKAVGRFQDGLQNKIEGIFNPNAKIKIIEGTPSYLGHSSEGNWDETNIGKYMDEGYNIIQVVDKTTGNQLENILLPNSKHMFKVTKIDDMEVDIDNAEFKRGGSIPQAQLGGALSKFTFSNASKNLLNKSGRIKPSSVNSFLSKSGFSNNQKSYFNNVLQKNPNLIIDGQIDVAKWETIANDNVGKMSIHNIINENQNYIIPDGNSFKINPAFSDGFDGLSINGYNNIGNNALEGLKPQVLHFAMPSLLTSLSGVNKYGVLPNVSKHTSGYANPNHDIIKSHADGTYGWVRGFENPKNSDQFLITEIQNDLAKSDQLKRLSKDYAIKDVTERQLAIEKLNKRIDLNNTNVHNVEELRAIRTEIDRLQTQVDEYVDSKYVERPKWEIEQEIEHLRTKMGAAEKQMVDYDLLRGPDNQQLTSILKNPYKRQENELFKYLGEKGYTSLGFPDPQTVSLIQDWPQAVTDGSYEPETFHAGGRDILVRNGWDDLGLGDGSDPSKKGYGQLSPQYRGTDAYYKNLFNGLKKDVNVGDIGKAPVGDFNFNTIPIPSKDFKPFKEYGGQTSSLALDTVPDNVYEYGGQTYTKSPGSLYQDGGTTYEDELSKFQGFIQKEEASWDYIKNTNSAVLKPDGKTYYKIYEGDKFYPYYHENSDGTFEEEATVGFGRKGATIYDDYKDGMDLEEAETNQVEDIDNSLRKTKLFINSNYGDGAYEKLNDNEKFMLTDFTYNLGKLSKYPSFADAIVTGDVDKAMLEYIRNDKPVSEGGKPLGRNNSYLEQYLQPWIDQTNKTNEEKFAQQAEENAIRQNLLMEANPQDNTRVVPPTFIPEVLEQKQGGGEKKVSSAYEKYGGMERHSQMIAFKEYQNILYQKANMSEKEWASSYLQDLLAVNEKTHNFSGMGFGETRRLSRDMANVAYDIDGKYGTQNTSLQMGTNFQWNGQPYSIEADDDDIKEWRTPAELNEITNTALATGNLEEMVNNSGLKDPEAIYNYLVEATANDPDSRRVLKSFKDNYGDDYLEALGLNYKSSLVNNLRNDRGIVEGDDEDLEDPLTTSILNNSTTNFNGGANFVDYSFKADQDNLRPTFTGLDPNVADIVQEVPSRKLDAYLSSNSFNKGAKSWENFSTDFDANETTTYNNNYYKRYFGEDVSAEKIEAFETYVPGKVKGDEGYDEIFEAMKISMASQSNTLNIGNDDASFRAPGGFFSQGSLQNVGDYGPGMMPSYLKDRRMGIIQQQNPHGIHTDADWNTRSNRSKTWMEKNIKQPWNTYMGNNTNPFVSIGGGLAEWAGGMGEGVVNLANRGFTGENIEGWDDNQFTNTLNNPTLNNTFWSAFDVASVIPMVKGIGTGLKLASQSGKFGNRLKAVSNINSGFNMPSSKVMFNGVNRSKGLSGNYNQVMGNVADHQVYNNINRLKTQGAFNGATGSTKFTMPSGNVTNFNASNLQFNSNALRLNPPKTFLTNPYVTGAKWPALIGTGIGMDLNTEDLGQIKSGEQKRYGGESLLTRLSK